MTRHLILLPLLAIALTACGTEPLADRVEGDRVPDSTPGTQTETANPSEQASSAPSDADDPSSTQQLLSDDQSFPVTVGTFTVDQLSEAGGGGCGMSLWMLDSDPWEDGILFFHGLEEDAALMKLNNELVLLNRTEASGEEFYGQQTAQTFMTDDEAIAIHVDAVLGAPGEIESVSISRATITIETQNQRHEIAAVGDAGC